jgi:hypothetical protein
MNSTIPFALEFVEPAIPTKPNDSALKQKASIKEFAVNG